jgi:hypothetical protein
VRRTRAQTVPLPRPSAGRALTEQVGERRARGLAGAASLGRRGGRGGRRGLLQPRQGSIHLRQRLGVQPVRRARLAPLLLPLTLVLVCCESKNKVIISDRMPKEWGFVNPCT